MTEPLNLDKIRARNDRAVEYLRNAPGIFVGDRQAHRAAWLVVTGDVPALLDEWQAMLDTVADADARRDAAEAAVARVRALAEGRMAQASDSSDVEFAIWPADLHAALDGTS